ncbi:MAG: metallophosphoesterase [Gemmatimonadales bacterium]|nr:metallophosphoesterase [Gemmatimonadales bacterium]
MYDIIGDIHGHAHKLEELLGKMGYIMESGHYQHRDGTRRAVFVGDFIDRGPAIRRTLEIVQGMVQAGTALAVMGNHEFNAIAYHTPAASENEWLRPHTEKNIEQHEESLTQLGGSKGIHPWLAWFRELPFSLDLGDLRVVHACWDPWAIPFLEQAQKRHGGVTTDFMVESLRKSEPGCRDLYWALEWSLKGKELHLPPGCTFPDKSNRTRDAVRARWFARPLGANYFDYTFPEPKAGLGLNIPVSATALAQVNLGNTDGSFYPSEDPPVFFGHYWLPCPPSPGLQTSNVVCLDYSVAIDGCLCAYRWDIETPLSQGSFVTV